LLEKSLPHRKRGTEEAVFGGEKPREWLSKDIVKSHVGLSTWLVDEVALMPTWRLLVRGSAANGLRPNTWAFSQLRGTLSALRTEVPSGVGGCAYVVARCALTGALDAPFVAVFGRRGNSALLAAYRVTLARPFEFLAVRACTEIALPLGAMVSRRAAIFAAIEAS